MFITLEKTVKKIQQDRAKGDPKRARERALDALKKWPEDMDLLTEAIQCCVELSDYHQAVSLFKTGIRQHPKSRAQILDYARGILQESFNPFLASFIIELNLRSRNLEGVTEVVRASGGSFVADLIKRSETRSKSFTGGAADQAGFFENELLLGLCCIEVERWEEAVAPLGRVLERYPEEAQLVGSMILQLERRLPDSGLLRFYLGLASALLKHIDKAEGRFFESLALEDPPLEKILLTIDNMSEKSANHQLLKGEILLRMGETESGASQIREYLEKDEPSWRPENRADQIRQLFPGHVDRKKAAHDRLLLLIDRQPPSIDILFLYCDIASGLEKNREIVEALERFHGSDGGHAVEIIDWLARHEDVAQTAPAQRLLVELHIENGDNGRAAEAARVTAEMTPSAIPALSQLIERRLAGADREDPLLLVALAELRARAGDAEGAQELLHRIEEEGAVEGDELMRLAGEILGRCGNTLDGVARAVELGARNGNPGQAVPYVLQFLRENPGANEELAGRIREIADDVEGFWPALGELVDSLAGHEQLSNSFKFLQAEAHLETGAVERAVFEFDQLMIFDDAIRIDLIQIYEKALERHGDNATLHLALYQLDLEEDQLEQAAHHLCKTLEIYPEQIRDVLKRFEQIIEREPQNRGIWEELIKTAIRMNHTNLARQALGRAIAALSREDAAALHVYGARISMREGKSEDALRCLAMALTSPGTDLPSIGEELDGLIAREPSNPEARFLLGETLVRLGREEESIDAFNQCLSLSAAYRGKIKDRLGELLPTSITPWLVSGTLGEIAWKENRREEAYRLLAAAQDGPVSHAPRIGAVLDRIAGQAPDDRRLALMVARNRVLEGRCDEAARALDRLASEKEAADGGVARILLELVDADPENLLANRMLASILAQSGEKERALEALLRILSHEEADPSEIDAAASPFIGLFERDVRFLVPYAGMKAEMGDHAEALERYREAFELDPSVWERITERLLPLEWPAELADTCGLLAVDCLIAGGRPAEAFERIACFTTTDRGTVGRIIERLNRIAAAAPARKHFLRGCLLLVGAGDAPAAVELADRGSRVLDPEDGVELGIELADMLQSSGHIDEARTIFKDIIDRGADRTAILRKVDAAHVQWIRREIDSRRKRLETSRDEEETERLVELLLEAGDPESAVELLCSSGIRGRRRQALLARGYIDMGRPLLAIAACGVSPEKEDSPGGPDIELLYITGRAAELVGDYGRAARAFGRIAAEHADYLDSVERAGRNYTRYLESESGERAGIIEKTLSLGIAEEKE